jgi:putative lipase involved disintegration of autophagic bodies
MTQDIIETIDQEETYTIEDVMHKIKTIQDMKILFSQQGVIFNDKDVKINHVVDKNALLKTIERYRNHYTNIEVDRDSISINNLSDLSYLRVGLEKEILRFMKPYF